jgi:GDP-4-dehydro-6-deoxy-D-mannose reductase
VPGREGGGLTAMRVGILGARGFVGAALARRLTDAGVQVVALNRPQFDLTDRSTWGALDCGLDVLVHAAGGRADTMWDTYRVNLLPCEALAERCNSLGLRRLVYLSTGRVYGYQSHGAYPGMDCNPVGDYPVSKHLAERVLGDHFAGEFAIARLYYPYGPGQKPPRLLPRLAAQVAAGEPLACAKGGGPRLTLTHVDDAAAVLARDLVLAENPVVVSNIASDNALTIADLAQRFATYYERPVEIIEKGEPLDEFSQPYPGFPWRPFAVEDVILDRSET